MQIKRFGIFKNNVCGSSLLEDFLIIAVEKVWVAKTIVYLLNQFDDEEGEGGRFYYGIFYERDR